MIRLLIALMLGVIVYQNRNLVKRAYMRVRDAIKGA